MKLCVPELELPELVAFAVELAFGGLGAEAAAVADDAVEADEAECLCVGEAGADGDPAVSVGVGAADVPGMADDAGAAADELDVLVPHAARLTPVMMTAASAAGTRLFLMPQSSVA